MSKASRARANRSRHRKIVALARAVHFDAHGECSDDPCSVLDNMLFHVDLAFADVFRQTKALRRTMAAALGARGGSVTGATKRRDVDYAALGRKGAAAKHK